MWDIIKLIFPYAIAYTVPILITSLGGLYSERSGVVNIGLEGLMVFGMFSGAYAISLLFTIMPGLSIWIGLLVGMLGGGLFAVLHAFASITLNANQVISGTAINMMAGALTLYIARTMTGSGNIQLQRGLPRVDIPLLSKIPILGPLLFTSTYASTLVVLAILPLSWFILYKTAFGLRLRACGEHPYAAASAGINVYRMRYIAVIISGMLSGLGGVIILVTYSGEFNGSVAGLGFLALAALIFGQWKPLGILGATFFFGFMSTMANISQVIPSLSIIPPMVLKIFPYVMTLIALVIFSKSSQAPKASGQPFDLGKK